MPAAAKLSVCCPKLGAKVAKFEELAARWWDPQSEFKPLHDINPLRLDYIDDRSPLAGKQVLDGIRNSYSEVRAHYLAEDLALATYRLDFDIKVKRQKAMTSWDRVMAVFRRVDGEWKLTAYAEAPMAPLTMVRKMLENAVPGDFDEFLEKE